MTTIESAESASKCVIRSKAVSTPDRAPTPDCFTNVVTIEVGQGTTKKYSIHKDLLCFYSDYFRGAFDGSFKEASEGRLPLPDEDVTDFDIFHGFLYTRTLIDSKGNTGAGMEFDTIIRAWIFGDKCIIPFYQNIAMDAFRKRNEELSRIPTSCPTYIYDNTVVGSPLRRVFIDIRAYIGIIPNLMELDFVKNWPHESLCDLILALHKKEPKFQGKYKMPKRDKCYYHVHAEGEHC